MSDKYSALSMLLQEGTLKIEVEETHRVRALCEANDFVYGRVRYVTDWATVSGEDYEAMKRMAEAREEADDDLT